MRQSCRANGRIEYFNVVNFSLSVSDVEKYVNSGKLKGDESFTFAGNMFKLRLSL